MYQPFVGLNLFDDGNQFDSSPIVYEGPAGSVPGLALMPIAAPVLTFLFTSRDAAITMNSVKNKSCSNEFLADNIAAFSTIGYHSKR